MLWQSLVWVRVFYLNLFQDTVARRQEKTKSTGDSLKTVVLQNSFSQAFVGSWILEFAKWCEQLINDFSSTLFRRNPSRFECIGNQSLKYQPCFKDAGSGGTGEAQAFGRSVNPDIKQQRGQIMPPHYHSPPQIFPTFRHPCILSPNFSKKKRWTPLTIGYIVLLNIFCSLELKVIFDMLHPLLFQNLKFLGRPTKLLNTICSDRAKNTSRHTVTNFFQKLTRNS